MYSVIPRTDSESYLWSSAAEFRVRSEHWASCFIDCVSDTVPEMRETNALVHAKVVPCSHDYHATHTCYHRRPRSIFPLGCWYHIYTRMMTVHIAASGVRYGCNAYSFPVVSVLPDRLAGSSTGRRRASPDARRNSNQRNSQQASTTQLCTLPDLGGRPLLCVRLMAATACVGVYGGVILPCP